MSYKCKTVRTFHSFEEKEFSAAELGSDEIKLLFLAPLVQVAWAHGVVSGREKRLIFDAARENGIDERHTLNQTLGNWLVYQPSRRFFDDCLNLLSETLRRMPVRERERERSKLLSRCQRVAATSGGDERFDADAGGISGEERELLARIIARLDDGCRQTQPRRSIKAVREKNRLFVGSV